MSQRFDLSGRVALVAGASRGIGEAIAHGLAQHGAIVICSSRKQADCEKVAEAIREAGGEAISAKLHLGELSDHGKVVDMIAEKYGRLDILINNGATNPYMGAAHEAPESAYDKTFDVNVKGPYFLSAKAIPLMLKNGKGAIVNVASIDGIQPGKGRVIYGMTKAALISMTKGMAKEYGNHGIRVNSLLPGFTDTKLASALKKAPGIQKFMDENLAISRMAQPEEMVGAVLYMVSDESSYFTGQGMVVDAGAIL
ncbi:short-chain dehydrogenase [Litorimonas cladophorae]|uniref:Short-chain dehydrogenase n=1 Tax=Litorimonas cladophorae TaxID=1220491 RepID=A0A918KCB9_9PROT|nr:glucose 1-dehydrogenase [Litorimonas cladophorae]GGX58709.1 short-chain dehydrogenase [Litorimonas cladophorae]